MMEILLVFLGGGVGAVSRYAVGRFVGERSQSSFPLGTCLINVSGCFALGMAASLIGDHNPLVTAGVATGFLGGYTTFSTYAVEGMVLVIDGGRRVAAVAYIVPVVLGLAAAALGALVAHAL